MGSENNAAVVLLALFLSFNILFITLTSAFDTNDVSNIIPTTTPGSFNNNNNNNNNIAPTTTTSGNAPTTSTSYRGGCPRDALQLGVCANLLNLVDVDIGSPPTLPCCSLIQGLVDLEAAVCLCTAIRANILGINLNVPISLSLVLNNCGRNVPNGFECS